MLFKETLKSWIWVGFSSLSIKPTQKSKESWGKKKAGERLSFGKRFAFGPFFRKVEVIESIAFAIVSSLTCDPCSACSAGEPGGVLDRDQRLGGEARAARGRREPCASAAAAARTESRMLSPQCGHWHWNDDDVILENESSSSSMKSRKSEQA